MKQLLIDLQIFKFSPNLIKEASTTAGGNILVTGVIQRAEEPNQNGRVYPKAILEREVNKYIETKIKQNRALGELDHPESSVINLKNVSHNIKKIWWSGVDVLAEIEILSTPSGNILKELLRSGIALGISSRGMGSVEQIKESEKVMVKDDFDLLCWDFVSDPSTHGAFMYNKKLSESIDKNTIVNKYSLVDSIISDILCDLTCECSIPKELKK